MSTSADLHAFITSTFRSVWALEILCHLKSVTPQALRSAEIVDALRASDLVVRQSLDCLSAAQLIDIDGEDRARYRPATAELERLCAEAEALYGKSPDAVRRLIVAARTPGIAAFADAFKLKKD
jgi:hypothetical protein